jgi:uncharacterized protein YneF (UPF0154 family)
MLEEIFIPIVFFLVGGAVWGTFILTRHKERMTMMEKGMSSEDIKAMYMRGSQDILSASPLASLKWGLLFSFVGVGVLVATWLRDYLFFNDAIFPSLILISGGAALVFFYFIARNKLKQ